MQMPAEILADWLEENERLNDPVLLAALRTRNARPMDKAYFANLIELCVRQPYQAHAAELKSFHAGHRKADVFFRIGADGTRYWAEYSGSFVFMSDYPPSPDGWRISRIVASARDIQSAISHFMEAAEHPFDANRLAHLLLALWIKANIPSGRSPRPRRWWV